MRCTCRRCAVRGRGGRRCAPMSAGGTRFKSSSRGLPPRSPDSTPVCAISLSSSLDVGSPRSPSGIPVVATPVSHHRNFRRSATGGTGPDHSSGRRHARHRLDEGVRQSRPGHPGVGRFGSCFPRRSPDPEDRTFFRRVPATDRLGYGRRAVSRPAPNFTHSLWHRRRVDLVVHLILGTPAVPVRRGRYWGVFLLLRTALGVSIPARGVYGFLLRPLRTGRDLRFSEVRVAAAFVERTPSFGVPPVRVVTTAPRRAFGPRVIRTRIRPLAGAECAPNSNRGRTAGPFRHDVPATGRTQACHAHLAAAENRSSETGRTEQMAVWTLRPVSEGHLTGVGRPV